ncbi:MAG: hypothetical protein Ct9H300mP1_22360 [Planctomycetaceae bacterium]|nr:MAG: hypothetical protein Ct9H300mP1_22360 [Planctomycetaceae bacterium]
MLYHSLQVYELIRLQRPYDVDLQLAALLHDVGKGLIRLTMSPQDWRFSVD